MTDRNACIQDDTPRRILSEAKTDMIKKMIRVRKGNGKGKRKGNNNSSIYIVVESWGIIQIAP